MAKSNRMFVISMFGEDIEYTTCFVLASMLVMGFERHKDQTIRTEYLVESEDSVDSVFTIQYYHKDEGIFKQVYFSDFDRAANCFKRTKECQHYSDVTITTDQLQRGTKG